MFDLISIDVEKWHNNLDPLSAETSWLDAFLKNYDNRSQGLIEYLESVYPDIYEQIKRKCQGRQPQQHDAYKRSEFQCMAYPPEPRTQCNDYKPLGDCY